MRYVSRAFIILTQGATKAEQTAIGAAFKGRGWWHRFAQAWVILDSTGGCSATSIRDEVLNVCPDLTHYVFTVEPGSGYSGFGPPDWEDWLKRNWKKK